MSTGPSPVAAASPDPDASPGLGLGPLVVRTVRVPDPGPLLELLPRDEAVAWVRRGEGLVGYGVAASRRTSGRDRFAEASRWWAEQSRAAVVRSDVPLPGTGLVCFGSFAFADDPGDSVLLVPEVVIGRRGDTTWVTTTSRGGISAAPVLRATDEPDAPRDVVFTDGAMAGTDWEVVIAAAVQRIGRGELEKVVLARDLVATAAVDIDVRWPLRRLAEGYPMCWTFAVDGLFGATPEMLVRRERGLMTSRVLAGTIRRTGDDNRDLALAGALARSSKDLEEHKYAVRSVTDALAPYCSSMNVPESPFVLHLPNVMHLATDVTGVGPAATSTSATPLTSLDLAAALHPSAAVGGTPTAAAMALIDELEGMDRGRYAGPVGWMDASGDGEWGLALRSGVLDGEVVRLFAGCGIVADSDPEAELAEAHAKFVPVRDAISG